MADPDTVNTQAAKEPSPTILVVEDEVLIRLSISTYLQDHGFRVLEARDSDEAVEILQARPGGVDLVFLDLLLPGEMDGFALARWLKRNRKSLPFLLGSGDAKKVAAASHLYENDVFLQKPYDYVELVRRSRDLTAPRKKR